MNKNDHAGKQYFTKFIMKKAQKSTIFFPCDLVDLDMHYKEELVMPGCYCYIIFNEHLSIWS